MKRVTIEWSDSGPCVHCKKKSAKSIITFYEETQKSQRFCSLKCVYEYLRERAEEKALSAKLQNENLLEKLGYKS